MVLGLLFGGSASAKVKTVEKNDDYIILKYSSALELDEKKTKEII